MEQSAAAKTAAVVLAAGLVASSATPCRATTYDAVTGFNKTENPSGPWSYLAGGKVLTHRETQGGDPKVRYWWNGKAMPDAALIGRNYGTNPYRGVTVVIYPDFLEMDPENVSDVAVRFTAPLTGTYAFKGKFKGTDQQEVSHPVAIAVNSKTVFSSAISSFGGVVPFKGRVHLQRGETIDFLSETNGGEADLSTGFEATIAGH